jgi:hypothetical protein
VPCRKFVPRSLFCFVSPYQEILIPVFPDTKKRSDAPSELHGEWVDPVNATRLKPCGLNGPQKDSKCINFLPGGTGMAQDVYGHPVAAGCGALGSYSPMASERHAPPLPPNSKAKLHYTRKNK